MALPSPGKQPPIYRHQSYGCLTPLPSIDPQLSLSNILQLSVVVDHTSQTSGHLASSRLELPRLTSSVTQHLRTPSVKSAAFALTPETTPLSTADNEKNDTSSLTANCSLRQSLPVTDDSNVPAYAVTLPPDLVKSLSNDEEKKRGSRSRKLDNRSNTHSPVFPSLYNDLSTETPLTRSDRDYINEPERSWQKRPILRKQSGELVRPALRPPSARWRPSSMPGTPTFSKAVHFDSHHEHVRHFLQVDEPLAVSAGLLPVEFYNSNTEFPFGKEGNSNGQSPLYKWEITVSNFPAKTPQRLLLPVRVEGAFLSANKNMLIGSVAVANFAFTKIVVARFTLDYWKTASEVVAEYSNDVHQQENTDGYDHFDFKVNLTGQADLEAKTMFFCVKYTVNGQEYWDNNNSTNFQVDFRKNCKPQKGKKAFDGSGDGFDAAYKFVDSKESIEDVLAKPDRQVRLKGSQSAIQLGSDHPALHVDPNRLAFGNRYDFSDSLSAGVQAVETVLGDSSSIYSVSSPKKQNKIFVNAPITKSPISTKPTNASKAAFAAKKSGSTGAIASGVSGFDSHRPARTERQVLVSQAYNELLDKYCFFGSSKTSPSLRIGHQ